MFRRVLLAAFFALMLVPMVGNTVSAQSRLVSVNPTADRLVELVNVQRAAAGLTPVTLNATLTAEAERFSTLLADMGQITHRGNDGSNAGQRITRAGYSWRFWGENLAAGQENADQVVAAWMASPGHRANIMNPMAREIGFGHTFRDNDPAQYYDYWVMEEAAPQ